MLLGLVVAIGAGTTAVVLQLRSPSTPRAKIVVLDSERFVCLGRTPSSVSCAFTGEDPAWRGVQLRFRTDVPTVSAIDLQATQQLAGRFAADAEVLHVKGASVRALADHLGVAAGSSAHSQEASKQLLRAATVAGDRGLVPCLRLRCVEAPPPGVCDGPAIVVELRPGSGVPGEMYGNARTYSVQDDSLLKRGERKASEYDPKDLFSGRPQLVRRALSSLAKHPAEHLCISVGDDVIIGGGARTAEGAAVHVVDVQGVLGAIASHLDGDGKDLLAGLLRAQCGAAGSVPGMARELQEVLAQHGGETDLHDGEVMQAAFARGFWSLSADYSGMRWREREAERLLERARRELWTEGSCSRRELEAEIAKFLMRYRVGVAASHATIRFSIVRPADVAESQDTLRQLGFRLSSTDQDMWVRIELGTLEVSPRHPRATP